MDIQIGAAKTIIAGADALDEMKRGIRLIDSIVTALVRQDELLRAEDLWQTGFTSRHGDGQWVLRPKGINKWTLEYWTKSGASWHPVTNRYMTGSDPVRDDVEMVFGALDHLVAALRERVPDFGRRIDPYIKAAPIQGM